MTRTIAILMPMIWSIRNVISSGLLDQVLAQDCNIKLIIPPNLNIQTLLPNDTRVTVLPLLKPDAGQRVPGYHLFQSVRNTAFSYRHGTYQQKKTFAQAAAPASKPAWHESFTQATGKALSHFQFAESAMDAWHARVYQKRFDLRAIETQLREHKIDLLFSTICVDQHEFPYVLTARRLGINTVTAILSFDNLSTRGRLPFFDHYLVWNERMKQELLKLYPAVPASQVTITGTPQFDFHRNPRCRWSREQTLEKLGLPPASRYILYGANHKLWTPTEPQLVQQLAARMAQIPALADLHIFARLHPLDEQSRWQTLEDKTGKVHIGSPWFAPTNETGWAPITVADQELLVNSLAHSEMCLNMASTMSLDAAIFDKPVICVAFAAAPGSVEEKIYREAYQSVHYRPLVKSRGLKLAHNWEELLAHISHAGTDQTESAARIKMVEEECGNVDGQAAQRIAAALQKLSTSKSACGNASARI